MKMIFAFMALTGTIQADELILKDGKKVEWKILTDAGDVYEVVTPSGTNVIVRKSDVERLSQKVAETPLTGATFTLDKKRVTSVDLLSHSMAKSDETVGSWRIVGGALASTASSSPSRARMPFDYTSLAEEYDLIFTAEVKEAVGELIVGLVVVGKQVAFHFDAFGGTGSCISQIDGGNGETIPGQVFQRNKPRTLRFMVRKEALIVQVDNKDFWTWKAKWDRVSLHSSLVIKSKDKIFFAIGAGTWQLSQITVQQQK